jgi:hypothetical protein
MVKETSKPSQLSQERVFDSSDEDADAMSDIEETGHSTAKVKLSSAKSASDESASEQSDFASDESQREGEAESETSSSSKKRSRGTTVSSSSAPLAKRPKKRSA